MDSSEIDALSSVCRSKSYDLGDIIVEEGDQGDEFYMIEEGTVDVFKASSGLKSIKSMSAGEFFGERALLSDEIRKATCIASSRVKCLVLGRDEFNRLLGSVQELLLEASKKRFDLKEIIGIGKPQNIKIE